MSAVIRNVDPEALAYWIKARGTNTHRIEQELRLGNGVLGKFLKGLNWSLRGETYLAVARNLGIPLHAILVGEDECDEEGCWKLRLTSDPEQDKKSMAIYSALCAQADFHWTIHHGLNSYLRHRDHFFDEERRTVLKAGLPAAEIEAYMERAKEFQKMMRDAQGSLQCDAFHWIVTQEAAFAGITDPAWIETTIERVQDLGLSRSNQRLVLSTLPQKQFADLSARIGRIVGSKDWMAINILDGRYALMQIGHFQSMACYHAGTVHALMMALRAAVSAVDPDFPAPGDRQEKLSRITARTHKYLLQQRRLLRSAI